jgi:aarF domain-containing kinase
MDLTIIHKLAHFADWLIPDLRWLSLPDEVRVFALMMRAQADLRVEASNLRRFHENFKEVDDISFPAPIDEYVTSSVLVEEYVNAIPISKFLGFHESQNWSHTSTPYDIELARIGIQAFLKMLIVDNFVHTDLHPGNILVTFRKPPSKSTPYNFVYRFLRYLRILPMFGYKESDHAQPFIDSDTLSKLQSADSDAFMEVIKKLHSTHHIPHMIFLDAGLVSELSEENLTNLHDLLEAVTRFSAPKVCQLLVSRSKDPSTVVNMPGFEKEMKQLLDSVKSSALRLSSVSFGGILKSVFDMVRQHRVRLEGEFVNVGVSLVLVEGIGRRLDPGVDLLGEVGPVLRIVRERDRERRQDALRSKVNTFEWWALQWWSVVTKVKEGLRLLGWL